METGVRREARRGETGEGRCGQREQPCTGPELRRCEASPCPSAGSQAGQSHQSPVSSVIGSGSVPA